MKGLGVTHQHRAASGSWVCGRAYVNPGTVLRKAQAGWVPIQPRLQWCLGHLEGLEGLGGKVFKETKQVKGMPAMDRHPSSGREDSVMSAFTGRPAVHFWEASLSKATGKRSVGAPTASPSCWEEGWARASRRPRRSVLCVLGWPFGATPMGWTLKRWVPW